MQQQERIMVLKMVEEGKITVDEAVKLIKAMGNCSDTGEKIKKAAKDMKGKISEMAKEAEPKVKMATKTVVSKTGEVVDELSKNIKDIINNRCERNNDCSCNDDDCAVYEYADYVDEPVDEAVDNETEVKPEDVVNDVVIEPVENKEKEEK